MVLHCGTNLSNMFETALHLNRLPLFATCHVPRALFHCMLFALNDASLCTSCDAMYSVVVRAYTWMPRTLVGHSDGTQGGGGLEAGEEQNKGMFCTRLVAVFGPLHNPMSL